MEAQQKVTSHYVGRTRIFFTDKPEGKKRHGMRVEGGAWRWFATAQAVYDAVEKIRKDSRKGKRKYSQQERFTTITCACGCGETGTVAYGTRPPRYLDDDHKRIGENKRRADRRAEKRIAKETAAARKAEKRAARKARVTLEDSLRARGVEGGGAGEGEGASPSPRVRRNKGLYADQPEPKRTEKRRKVGLPAEG